MFQEVLKAFQRLVAQTPQATELLVDGTQTILFQLLCGLSYITVDDATSTIL